MQPNDIADRAGRSFPPVHLKSPAGDDLGDWGLSFGLDKS